MSRRLRAFAVAVAVAAVLDPAIERQTAAPVRVGVRVAASPSDDTARLLARLTDALGDRADIVHESDAGGAPWCVAVAVCLAVGDGTVPMPGRPAIPVQAVRLTPSGPLRVVAARAGPGHVAERSDAVVAVAGGREGDAIDVVIEDRGVEVGRVAHRRTGRDVDRDIVVPWWPRGAGPRTLTARIDAAVDRAVAAPATTIADTASTPAEVLVWEARPSWTGTFVRRALQADARLAVRAASRVAPGRVVGRGVSGRPDDEALRRAQAVVVAGANALDASSVVRLEQFARGGGVVIVALDEDPAGPVRALLPGVPSGRRRALDPVMVGGVIRAAELVSFADGDGTVALARWNDQPAHAAVVVERPTGRGRIVVSGALDAWRWRDDESGFDRFWRDVVVRSARDAAPPLAVSWTAGAGTSDVKVVSRDGMSAGTWPRLRLQTICAGVATPLTPIEAAAPGTWTARVPHGAPGCTVEAAIGETAVTSAWPGVATVPPAAPGADALERLASASGGAMVALDRLEPTLAALVAAAPAPLVPETWHPMRAWWWFVPFTAALAVEWWRRWRRGTA